MSGYFCKANLGFSKGEVEFLPSIINKLDAEKSQVTMVGDSLLKDIQPAIAAGINAIWLTDQPRLQVPHGASAIQQLNELCI
ncbi:MULTISPECIES: HAD hydrolase-like protein [unclassified Shewanella]|uniref:HAD hydrolase-like protein n=1 Tax=unclassified Shewanella TaxID=196818 RepID=UPI001F533A98|nr:MULTISPECIES: HAD hydrolase-like protein [unclassified Shewanella]MDO6775960.1 HAD hydrolase-like protein [Shewanella sp. 3_MG-2023]